MGGKQKKREVLTMREKLNIIRLVEVEKRSCYAVARMYKKDKSAIRIIIKNKDKILHQMSFLAPDAKVFENGKRLTTVKVEEAVCLWIRKLKARNMFPSDEMIISKANELNDEWRTEEEAKQLTPYRYSKKWLTKFKTKYIFETPPTLESNGQRLVEMTSVNESVSSSSFDMADLGESQHCEPPSLVENIADESFTNPTADQTYTDYLKTLNEIDDKTVDSLKDDFNAVIAGYDDKQIFCVDQTNLFWKKLPLRTFIHNYMEKSSELKSNIDRFMLTICGNAYGHFIKPGLIYRKPNPRALRFKYKHSLPVFWQTNAKVQVTSPLFLEWFNQCFIPEVKKYLQHENLPFKVLLIVNESPWQPPKQSLEDDNVRIFCLPIRTSETLNPMKQGLFRVLKANYVHQVFKMLGGVAEQSSAFGLFERWQTFSIADAMILLRQALMDVNIETVLACWENLRQNEYETVSILHVDYQINKIVQMAKTIGGKGFGDLMNEDVRKLVDDPMDEVFGIEDFHQLKSPEESEDEERKDEKNIPDWTYDKLSTLFDITRSLQSVIRDADPNMERSIHINEAITKAVNPLSCLFAELKQEQQLKKFVNGQDTESSNTFEHIDLQNLKNNSTAHYLPE